MILNFLGRFKNSSRLGFGFGIIFIFFLATIFISIVETKTASKSMNDLYNTSYRLNTSILQIDSEISKIQFILAQASDAEIEDVEIMIVEIKDKNKKIRDNFKTAAATFHGDMSIIDKGIKLFEDWVVIQNQILQFALEENIIEADDLVATKGTEYAVMLNVFTEKIIKIASEEASEFVAAAAIKEKKNFRILILTAAACFFISLLICYFLTNSILVPINNAVYQANLMKTGDFTSRFNSQLKDEFGELANALDDTNNSLGTMIKGVRDNIEILFSSSSGMTDLSDDMAKNAEVTSGKSEAVTQIINELKQNFIKISNIMEETNANTAMVASATSQMNVTINEIAQNSEKAKTISEDAVQLTDETTLKMNELSKAAEGIGNVTETITKISEQTNLLALNATIEAARAGDAGKGFAVVANEIKELAKQTADAINDIKSQIEGVQSTTSVTAGNIDTFVGVIREINDIISITATAVEEQSITTSEIAKNIEGVTDSINVASGVVSDNTDHIKQINTDILDVNHSSTEMSSTSNLVNESALKLKKLATQLTDEINRFKV